MRKSVSRGLAAAAFGALLLGPAASAFAATGDTAGTDLASQPVPAAAAPSSDVANGAVVVDSTLILKIDQNDKAFTLHGFATQTGVTADDNTVSYVVTTNNASGYSVGVKSDQSDLLPADTAANTDKVSFDDITATGTALPDGTVANGGTSLGGSTKLATGGTIYSQTGRSDATGDEHKTTFSADLPFVNSGEYDGTLTFTATANA